MMARNSKVPFKGRIQKRKTYHLQIITFGLQRAAGPYRWAIFDQVQWGLPIGPFRLALRADIPPAHLATRVFGEFARTNKSLGLLGMSTGPEAIG